ncbi:MAG: class I SAM-dependent methyltransferase [Methanomassiliicoccales archaeon]|nr:MAG: class I SAM-dependent methyltransferase [Methanomassiliicoccales archaeon]
MRRDFLKRLICPDCKSDFDMGEIYTKTNTEIINGIVRCDCSEYPIIDGILIYKKPFFHERMSSTAYLVTLMRTNRLEDAISLPHKDQKLEKSLLNMHDSISALGGFKKPLYPILHLLRWKKRQTYRRLTSDLTFFDLMDILEPNNWGEYLKHRFSSQTFWSLYPFIPLIERKNEMVLDLGCGAGHGSFILSKYIKPENLVCADENYTMLYLAKKYMAKGANFICLDANNPLPFSDDAFSSIFIMDLFHFVYNRALLAKEFERMLKNGGLLLLLHLHNILQNNVSQGLALSPQAWQGLLPRVKISVLPENPLIEDFMMRYELDLTKKYQDEEINGSYAISIVGSTDEELLGKFENLNLYIEKHMQNPILNPIYEKNRKNNEILLKRTTPNDIFFKESPLSLRFLPEKYSVPIEISKALEDRKFGKLVVSPKHKKKLDEMIRRFIVIDTPKEYF